MARSARSLVVLALVVACATPAAALAADPLPEGAVRTADGRVLPPLPEELWRRNLAVLARSLAQIGGHARV